MTSLITIRTTMTTKENAREMRAFFMPENVKTRTNFYYVQTFNVLLYIVIIKNIPTPEYYAALPLAKIDKLRYNKCVCKYKQYFMEGKV